MSGPNLTTHIPCIPVRTVSGNTEYNYAYPEKSGQTFLGGVPVMLSSGYVQKWDGATLTDGILGVTYNAGLNLGTNGAGAPGPFQQIGGSGAIQTWGSVQNQPSAVNIALGTPISDGRSYVALGQGDTVFEAMVDNSSGSGASSYTPTQANIGAQFGLTFDTTGYIYVDLGKSTAGTNTVVVIVAINPVDGFIVNARVQFVFLKAAVQIQQ